MNKLFFFFTLSVVLSSCTKDINDMENYEGLWEQSEARINGLNVFVPTEKITIEIYNAEKEFSNFTETVRYRWNDEIVSTQTGKYEFINKGEAIDRIQESLVVRQEIKEFSDDKLQLTYKIREFTFSVTYLKQ